jgi:uncharacterized membrane protein YkgB
MHQPIALPHSRRTIPRQPRPLYPLRDRIGPRLEAFDARVTTWLLRHGITLLRAGLGVVYLWFGVLKFFPGASPAQDLAARTIGVLTFGLIGPEVGLVLLAGWECSIGLALVAGVWVRAAILALLVQMLGTFSPLVFFPDETFLLPPYAPTLEGQYILKNIVLGAAALVIGASSQRTSGLGNVDAPLATPVALRAQILALDEVVAAGGSLRAEELTDRLLARCADDPALRAYVASLGCGAASRTGSNTAAPGH